jgi:hypothetical protein
MVETRMTWLRPNTLGLVLFLPCLALAQYLPASGLTVWLAIAMGRFAISPTATWATLLGVQLVGVYVVSMPLGELLAMATRPRRRDVLLAVCATAVAAFVAAAIVSEQYWGYYFRRPALDERVARARQVHAVTFVETQGAGEPSRFVASPDQSHEAAIRAGRKHPYGFPSYRALVTLADRRLLPEGPAPVRAATLASTHAWLEATGLLVPGEAGYPHAKRLGGVLLELEDETGEALTFVGVKSGEVSNDHYAYYELVLSAPPGTGSPRRLSEIRFFYDIAGIEGVEWWVMWIVFGALGNAITVPATVIAGRALGRR